jgi:hypothetical protein
VTVLGSGEQATSTACGKSVTPCGTSCSRFRIVYAVPLAAGRIVSTVRQRQVSSADGKVVGITVQGVVSRATRAYAALRGAAVNGGGVLVFQPDGSAVIHTATAITPTA